MEGVSTIQSVSGRCLGLPHSLWHQYAAVGALEAGRWDSGTRDDWHLMNSLRMQKPSAG